MGRKTKNKKAGRAGRRRREMPERKADEIEKILRTVDALPTLDKRREEEILGVDQHGLPSAAKWPDFHALARKILGDRVLPGADLVIKERGRY
jgi:hypothetical protein